MGSFAAQVKAFRSTVITRQDAFTKELLGQIALSLIVKSPVGDPAFWKNPKSAPPGYVGGNFKANWRLGVGAIDSTIVGNIDPDGGATLDRIVGTIPEDARGKVYFLTNPLPYAIRLEDGWSKRQAPAGMVTLTVIEFHDMIAKARAKALTINGASFGQ